MIRADGISTRGIYAILAIAVVVFLSFATVFVLQKTDIGTRRVSSSPGDSSPSDEQQQLIRRANTVVGRQPPEFQEWTMPDAQSDDGQWIYDVFTPPRIYINPETGGFEPTAYQFHAKSEVAELELLSVSRSLFRYQLAGYVENSLTHAEQSILLIEDVLSGETGQFRFREGGLIGEGFKMSSFVIEKVKTEAGGLLRRGVLTLSGKAGEAVLLKSSEPAYCDGFRLSLSFDGAIFELSSDTPFYHCETGVVTWQFELSHYPDFVFEVFDSETSTRRSVTRHFYLPN